MGQGQKGRGRAIMVQGTTSYAGKSTLVTALCRIFRQGGLSVAPFKAQNMSNNAYVTAAGEEVARAQAVQAEAAGVAVSADMNPLLLKPQAEAGSQVIVRGRPLGVYSARAYHEMADELWPVVTESLDRLLATYDIVVIEGAGSPAEINLRHVDLVNMRVARYCRAPVLLVGDIDRGGVFAALYGTWALLEPEERALLRAFVINKFRGDVTILEPGLGMLQERTGIPTLGVLPYFRDIQVPSEDSLSLQERPHRGGEGALLEIAVLRLPRIANFDDFEPFERDPGVAIRYVERPTELAAADCVIIPGTKATMADLRFLRERGLAEALLARYRAGVPVIGICGGYQMLGSRIVDPDLLEGDRRDMSGLGLLDGETTFSPVKATRQVRARIGAHEGLLAAAAGVEVAGYEIHMGQTLVRDQTPFSNILGADEEHPDGAVASSGLVFGTYLHGLFHNDAFRRVLLEALAARKGVVLPPVAPPAEDPYDLLAARIREHLDVQAVLRLVGP